MTLRSGFIVAGAPGPAVAHVQSTSTSTSPTAVRMGLPALLVTWRFGTNGCVC